MVIVCGSRLENSTNFEFRASNFVLQRINSDIMDALTSVNNFWDTTLAQDSPVGKGKRVEGLRLYKPEASIGSQDAGSLLMRSLAVLNPEKRFALVCLRQVYLVYYFNLSGTGLNKGLDTFFLAHMKARGCSDTRAKGY